MSPTGHISDLRWLQLTPLCFIKDLGLQWEAFAWESVRPACCKGFWVTSQLGMLPHPVACSEVKWGGAVSALPYCAGTSWRERRVILSGGLTRTWKRDFRDRRWLDNSTGSHHGRLLGAAGGGWAVLFPSTCVLDDISPRKLPTVPGLGSRQPESRCPSRGQTWVEVNLTGQNW